MVDVLVPLITDRLCSVRLACREKVSRKDDVRKFPKKHLVEPRVLQLCCTPMTGQNCSLQWEYVACFETIRYTLVDERERVT